MLDSEREFFNSIQSDLLTAFPGQFVVIKDRELVGAYPTIQDALAEGARRFGLQNFLVRRVDHAEQEVSIPALSLGILSANPSHTVRG